MEHLLKEGIILFELYFSNNIGKAQNEHLNIAFQYFKCLKHESIAIADFFSVEGLYGLYSLINMRQLQILIISAKT